MDNYARVNIGPKAAGCRAAASGSLTKAAAAITKEAKTLLWIQGRLTDAKLYRSAREAAASAKRLEALARRLSSEND